MVSQFWQKVESSKVCSELYTKLPNKNHKYIGYTVLMFIKTSIFMKINQVVYNSRKIGFV